MNFSVNGLSFSYASVPVLKNVSFCANKGECIAILGINGAGKSTLLKCIDRILNFKTGSIETGRGDIRKMKPGELAKIVGYVPQRLTFADSTVFDAVLLGRKPYIKWEATKKDLQIVDGLLERMNLFHLSCRNVSELSGGEQQKTAVARALAQEPEFLLFDEPTSNLDIKNQIDVINLIKKIAEKSRQTVIVTMHDLSLALRFADRFIMMKENTVYSSGGPETVNADTIREVYGLEADVVNVCGKTVIVPK